MPTAAQEPTSVRELDTPAARRLAGLAEVLGELHMVLRCCERLTAELAAAEPDELAVEALWTTALLSYARCFAGELLTEEDVTGTGLRGEVLEWHHILRQLRDHYAHPAHNPRERCSVGITQDEGGHAGGVAITAMSQPALDDATVRQTGALAYALSGLVDERMTRQQEAVRAAAAGLRVRELERLPRIDVAGLAGGAA
ncbi:hypothetical protein [Prauserella muralis]|uniref:Uncharacterized protein n=1 Tax=Prauserella muralis TaxID=588067 RepID=A0A2V4B1Y4_9PSEU|nr:hypothetical protein [Prauserella muralis]PXY28002.1 hypothetical protein BAY60_16790 [Prauserella muralis]TWE22208.1 hypothetical protein FHX69_3442 [Prauserella muralis]